MKLENSFTIDAPVEKAWEALNNPETVAPCFPGATLTAYEGDSFNGTVKVKLGPIAMTYKGKGTYVSRDEAAHEVVIDATGRDSRGNGTASAKVTASLAADGPDRTAVTMVTDMTITGKPAQFGRGVISDVADKIIGQFSACVARKLAPEAAAAGAASSASSSGASSGTSTATSAAAAASGGAAAPVSEAEAPAADVSSASTVHFPSSADASSGDPAGVPSGGAAVSGNGAAPAPSGAAGASGTSETEAPASGILDAVAPNPPKAQEGGTSEAEAPAVDMAGGKAPAPETPAGPVAGTSEAEAPAADMRPDPRTTSTVASPAVSSAGSAAPRPSGLQGGPVRSEVDAIDLFDTAGAPVLKRLAPAAGVGVLLLLVFLLVRRLRSS